MSATFLPGGRFVIADDAVCRWADPFFSGTPRERVTNPFSPVFFVRLDLLSSSVERRTVGPGVACGPAGTDSFSSVTAPLD